MANQINSTPAFTVHRAVGNVVLTMTPQQAQQVAASIWPEDAEHTDWLDTLPDMLRAAADENASPAHSSNSDSQQQVHAALVENIARIRHNGLDSASPYNDTVEQAQAVLAHNARFRHNGFDSSSYLHTRTAPAVVRSAVQAGMTYAEALAHDIEPTAPKQVAAVAITAGAVTLAAVAAGASRTYEAARAWQAAITTRTAQATAGTVRRTAYLLKLHTDEETQRTATAAAVLPDTEAAVSAENARALASTVQAAVTAKENTIRAAATVARAAETTAADAAASAADAFERRVADTGPLSKQWPPPRADK